MLNENPVSETQTTSDSITRTFTYKHKRAIKSIILDVLVAGACFFFIGNMYEIIIDSLNVQPNQFVECTVYGYLVYRITKFLRD